MGKKNNHDRIITLANLGDTRARKKLRAWLRVIARNKQRLIPKRMVDELEKAARKVRFRWTCLEGTDLRVVRSPEWVKERTVCYDPSQTLEDFGYTDEDWGRFSDMWYQSELQGAETLDSADHLDPVVRERIRHILETEGMRPWKINRARPHLVIYGTFGEFTNYLIELVPKLQDADWVGALSECPTCGRLLLNFTKWRNRYCDKPDCKKGRKAVSARRRRKRIKCPALNGLNDEITVSQCSEIQTEESFEECDTCTNCEKNTGGESPATRKTRLKGKGGSHGSYR